MCRGFEDWAERRAVYTQRANVPGRASDIGDVQIQDRRRASERNKRALHIALTSQQAAFFGRHRDEYNRAGGPGQMRERLGRAQDRSHPRGVILSSIVDGVAAHRGTDSFVVPMRSEERRVGKECRSRWWPGCWRYQLEAE